MTPDQIRQLVGQGKLDRAIQALKANLSGSDLRNEVTSLEFRLEKLTTDGIIGVSSNSESGIVRNQIANGILQLVDRWESGSIIDEKEGSAGQAEP
ncbi:MAG: hypothetical protein AAGF87_19045, partial [Bacteroidota bacterium]